MAFIYVTKTADRKARGYDFDLHEWIARHEERSNEELNQLLDKRPPYLYDKVGTSGGRLRLVIKPVELVTPSPLQAFCVLTIFRCGDDDYERFKDSSVDQRREWLEPLLDMEDLQQEAAKFLAKQNKDRNEIKQPLPSSLASWLEPFADSADDELVMESRLWVERLAHDEKYKDQWKDYYNLVQRLAQDRQAGEPLSDSAQIRRVLDNGTGRSIYGTHLSVEGVENVLLLLSPFDPRQETKSRDEFEKDICRRFAGISEKRETVKLDDVARYARRSYPAYLLADDEVWKQLQQDEEANLALSTEEAQLLKRARCEWPRDGAVLPLFINGRAGSGKSTMLYHLFADYVSRKTQEALEGEIIFLTYTPRLRDLARKKIDELLRSRADFIAKRQGSWSEFDSGHSTRSVPVLTFREFLLDRVPLDQRTQYEAERYLSYSLFSRLYTNERLPPTLKGSGFRGSRKVPPAMAWHIVRALIRGWRYDHDMEPDDYAEVPKKERSVTLEEFKTVYGEVWRSWLQPLMEEQRLWDEVKIASNLLSQSALSPDFAVIFCDEAQDFTRLELNFLVRLLLYHRYDLGRERYVRLPFVLAGDPFQTINPTGFRWEAVKASFYSEVVLGLDPYGRKTIGFDYQPLTYNYRSQPNIVGFSNLVLLWRHLCVGADVTPQQGWFDDDESESAPMLFTLGKTLPESQIHDIIEKNPVIIVPCEQGQEEEFIENDSLLRSLKQHNETLAVLSPMEAKGAEFKAVVVYKFGEHCPEGLIDKRSDDDLTHHYFLNKLYVAVTRAKRNLVLIDTVLGEDRLWKSALKQGEVDRWVKQASRPQEWKDRVSSIQPGNLLLLTWEKQDPLTVAETLRNSGKAEGNARLLRQAKAQYRRAGRDDLAKVCEAEALEIEGLYREAGQAYCELVQWQDAERCFWAGKHYDDLLSLAKSYERLNPRYRVTAKFMRSPRSADDTTAFLEYYLDSLKKGDKVSYSEAQFLEAMRAALKVASRDWNRERISNIASLAAEVLDHLRHLHNDLDLETVAHIYYASERYREAVAAWEKLSGAPPAHREYARAKAQIATWPENLKWWHRAGDMQTVVEEFQSRKWGDVPPDVGKLVADAYRRQGYWQHAIEMFLETKELGKAIELLRNAISDRPQDVFPASRTLVDEVYHALVEADNYDEARELVERITERWPEKEGYEYARQLLADIARGRRWGLAIRLVSAGSSVGARTIQARSPWTPLRLSPSQKTELQMGLIEELARSDGLTAFTRADREDLAEYLLHFASEPNEIWRQYLGLPTLAAALERVLLDKDLLPLYERMEQNPRSRTERRFVRERWLKVKTRQIERLQKSEPHEADRARLISLRTDELNKRADEWGIALSEIGRLPEYPDPGTPLPPEVPSDFSVAWRDPYCRITNIPTGSDLTINVASGEMSPFGAPNPHQRRETDRLISFALEEWRLKGRLQKGEWIEFTLNDERYRYELQRARSEDASQPEEEPKNRDRRGRSRSRRKP